MVTNNQLMAMGVHQELVQFKIVMTKDEQAIYDSYMHAYDYLLLEDVTNFNWDTFFERYFFESFYIFEKVTLISDIPNNFGEDSADFKYEIELSNNKKFIVDISMLLASSCIRQIHNDIQQNMSNNFKHTAEQLAAVKQCLESKKNQYVCVCSFKDDKGRLNVTGEVGKYSVSVLKSVESAIKETLYHSRYKSKTCMFAFISSKLESKRHQIYNQLISRTNSHPFNHIVEDTTTNTQFNKIYLF